MKIISKKNFFLNQNHSKKTVDKFLKNKLLKLKKIMKLKIYINI